MCHLSRAGVRQVQPSITSEVMVVFSSLITHLRPGLKAVKATARVHVPEPNVAVRTSSPTGQQVTLPTATIHYEGHIPHREGGMGTGGSGPGMGTRQALSLLRCALSAAGGGWQGRRTTRMPYPKCTPSCRSPHWPAGGLRATSANRRPPGRGR